MCWYIHNAEGAINACIENTLMFLCILGSHWAWIGFSTLLLSCVLFYLDYKRKKGSIVGSKSLNYYSFCRWVINWNSRGGYKVLWAEKVCVSFKGLALQFVIKKERKGQIKKEIACITWMIKPSTSVLKCVWFFDVLLCWLHFFFLSASFISPPESVVFADDRMIQI